MINKKQFTIGIDIGGTKISGVLFDGKNVLADYVLGTPKDDFNHFMIMLGAVIEPLLAAAKKNKKKVAGIGLGIAGVMDKQAGKVRKSPNISFLDNKYIRAEVEKKFSLPVKIENDAACFVRAEAIIGAGGEYKSVYGITIGTGIGGAWWTERKIFEGAHGTAGEPGHIIVDFKEKIDLEGVYHRLMGRNPEEMAARAYAGDKRAEMAFLEFGGYLGMAFANIINIIDPEIFVIGGGVVESSELFLGEVKKSMLAHAFSPEAGRVKVVKAKLGEKAGAIGAALLFS